LKVGNDYSNKALQLRNLWSRNASCAGLDQNLEYAYSLELNPFFTNPQPDGERYFYHSDHLGSSAYITTENGYATQFLAYMPYGETLSEQQNSTSYYSPFKFSAKEKDTETGYSYFGARYYSPELSVWLSIDPLADKAPGWTPYRYGFNNPIRFIDPTGMLETDGDPTKKGDEKPKATPPQAPSKPAPNTPQNYGDSPTERFTNSDFWIDYLLSEGAFSTDPNVIEISLADNLATWFMGGGPAVAKYSKSVLTYLRLQKLTTATRGLVNYTNVLNSAQSAYKGTTVLGHALSKHAGRNPSIWGKLTGHPSTWHNQALKHFDDIMRSPGDFIKTTTQQGINFLEKRLPDGRGIRLNMDGTFKGFID
jgi:RHS repeat-associated protein